jgi:hypothetical protein
MPPPFPGLTRPKVPVNVEEMVPEYETNEDVRKVLREKQKAAAEQINAAAKEARKALYREHFGTKAGGRTRAKRAKRVKRSKAKSRRRK